MLDFQLISLIVKGMKNQFSLLKTRRFLPLFTTQILGAFNDNLFKTALSVLIAYGLWDTGGMKPEMLVSLAAAIFILPFVILAPLSGILADKFDKAKIMQMVKIAEIGIAGLAIISVVLTNIPLSLFVIFCFGLHSAIFSPCKFAILPQHLKTGELIGGNALANTGTYLAILGGNILGSLLAVHQNYLFVILIACAIAGYAASRFIPKAPAPSPKIKITLNSFAESAKMLRYLWNLPDKVFRCVIGIGWFYFTGALMLAQFPNYTSLILGADHFVLAFFMIIFSLGIGLGGLLNNKLLRSKIDTRYAPYALLGMMVFSGDLYAVSEYYVPTETLINLKEFLSYFTGWRITFDLLALAMLGGIYVVPLQSIVQHKAPQTHTARVLAASGLISSVFILLSSIVAIAVLGAGFTVKHLFVVITLGSFLMMIYLRGVTHKSKSKITGT